MKEETNNEMDLLLRRLGRRPDISVSDGNGDVDHLDADELSAYAENVLPPAARMRYTEHLAECARCRELVVQLSLSAGVVAVAETPRAAEPSAPRKFLASLFSPMVLRYAVPALGLIVVAAIGFFVLKQRQREAASIAQNVEAPNHKTTITSSPEPSTATFGYYDQQTKESAGKPAQRTGSPTNQPAAAAAEPPPPATDRVADAPRDELAKKQEQQPVTNEAPKPAPTFASEEKRQAEKAVKEPPRVQVAAEPQTEKTVDSVVKDDDRKAAEIAKARADTANKSRGVGAAQGIAATTGSSRAEISERGRNSTETRTVAGRHFRKQDNVWIDTAYESSQRITGLSRGSEQYRALIADEPAIKTIADQLDGEIIVVWKGHTYRIK